MYRFYVENSAIEEEEIHISGGDVNHIKNVLRMKLGEKLIICNGQGIDYYCIIAKVCDSEITVKILEKKEADTELKAKIYLFQGLPKKDKMELIVQKAVELGAYSIIPVMMKRTIVKIEDKKKELKKLERWQSIAEGAAKQSMRGRIPTVCEVMTYQQATAMAKDLEIALLPYECATGISRTKELLEVCKDKKSIGILIGPEGGFEPEEVEMAKAAGIEPITLGKRILRTETAGLTILSNLMFALED
jgi:16S rRNA (uracil1498-N3)-methyltransferase